MRLDLTAASGPVAAAVCEANALAVAARRCDHRELLGVDGGAGSRQRERRRAERSHTTPQVRGQHLLQLDERSHGGLLDARHRRASRGAEAHGDRDRLLVIQQQGRHRASRAKPVSARAAGERLDRVAELAQPLDVTPDRAARHLEPVCELLAAPVSPRLQQ